MLAEAIKLLAQQQNDGTYPTAVLFGTVKAINPLKVQIDSKIIVEDFLVIAERLTKNDPLKVNDKVIVLRQQGGKKYIILDRIGG
jgi:hypothetical protein